MRLKNLVFFFVVVTVSWSRGDTPAEIRDRTSAELRDEDLLEVQELPEKNETSDGQPEDGADEESE